MLTDLPPPLPAPTPIPHPERLFSPLNVAFLVFCVNSSQFQFHVQLQLIVWLRIFCLEINEQNANEICDHQTNRCELVYKLCVCFNHDLF